jgi:hypothetical protein
MLIPLARTAFQALTFNVDPALLPRWESGPLLLALAAAVLSSVVPGAPVNALIVMLLAALLAVLKMLTNAGISRSIPRESVALAYLMCVGVLIFNVPAAVIAGLGLAYSGGPGGALEVASSAGASGFRAATDVSPALAELLKDLGGLRDVHAFTQDSSSVVGQVALVFILLSLASARPKIRRAFLRDDVRIVRRLLMATAAGQPMSSSWSPTPDDTDPTSRRERP